MYSSVVNGCIRAWGAVQPTPAKTAKYFTEYVILYAFRKSLLSVFGILHVFYKWTTTCILRDTFYSSDAKIFSTSTSSFIQNNTEHPLRLQTNTVNNTTIAITINNNDTVFFQGTVFFANETSNASDSRLKSIPVDASIEDSLNMIKSVSGRTYERTDKPGTGTRVGFIAQEVQASLPIEFANLIGKVKYSADPDEENPMDILTRLCSFSSSSVAML
jgi:hypothetical protein